jgi:hypothetical protein
LVDHDMVPFDSDAVRGYGTNRLSVLAIDKMGLDRDTCIPPCRILDPRRIRRSLQRDDHLLARFLSDEHRRFVRRIAWPDQRAFSTSERLFDSLSAIFTYIRLQALGPTLIIVRAGLRGSSSSSSFTPVKGSINKSHGDPPSRHNPRDVESGTRSGDGMVVHIEKATDVCLEDGGSVSMVCALLTSSRPDMCPP